jgi:4-amino-4-deoxy-L-arabinose transferase-like glycosyltransferase
VSSKTNASVIFLSAFTALILAVHLPYVKLPFFWDELGQFVPAALDIFHRGAWIPRSTLPNVHPPGVMAYLALVWRIFGYSIPATRAAMLMVASAGLLFSFLLMIRLCRGVAGMPAFAAVIFLFASPMFYTQAMMAQLDMPAMTFTALALLLFLDARYAACALACTVLVLVKETGVSTPAVLAAWLWLREGKRREALYFLVPVIALGGWLLALRHATGHWLGNAEFAQYNVADSLQVGHVLATLVRRVYFLFVANGLFLGSVALFAGSRVLRGREWRIVVLVAAAQLLLVSVLGGAALDRYVLPVLPVVYAAMAAAGSVYPRGWRWATQAAMTAGLILGFFWNPPYPFPFEDNLAMTDFVALQQEAASYLEAFARDQRIASVWPFTDAAERPEFGYVGRPLRIESSQDFSLASLAGLDRGKTDVLVVFSQVWGLNGGLLDRELVRNYLIRHWGYRPQASSEEIREGIGFIPVVRWTRGGQWIEIYLPER